MAELTDPEARLVIAGACDPADKRVGVAVEAFGAQQCVADTRLLPPQVAARLDLRALEQLDSAADCSWVVPGAAGWPPEFDLLGALRPLGVWWRGRSHLAAACRTVSIVGSRSATQYGEYIAGEFAAGVAVAGFAVVSGGAYGIDAAAHRGALAVRGGTFAVLAGGVDVPYPRSNHALFERILDCGALVSEAPLGRAPLRHHFLVRNRLIAAWGQATVVVEARVRSGALATASHAALLGRDVLAVPGSVTSAASAGCHQLIRDGAVLAASPLDVLELIDSDLPRHRQHPTQSALDFG